MAICHQDADAIEAARTRNNVVIFIGYMRRYAEAFLRAKEEIKRMKIDYVRVRDIIGNVSIDRSKLTTERILHFAVWFVSSKVWRVSRGSRQSSSERHGGKDRIRYRLTSSF